MNGETGLLGRCARHGPEGERKGGGSGPDRDWAERRGRKRRRWAAGEEEKDWAVGKDSGRAGLGCWAGFRVFFLSHFLFFFLIQTKLNLFEFRFEFEFKPHSIK